MRIRTTDPVPPVSSRSPLFEREAILAEARAESGLSDFGDPGFLEGLDALLESYDRHFADPDVRGRHRRVTVKRLVTRLRVQAALAAHPEIRRASIRAPMILTGMPRAGTSALLNLLAEDPAARPLLTWEIHHPEPLDGLASDAPDPRRAALMARREAQRNPEFDKAHYAGVDLPEECVLLQMLCFDGVHQGYEILLEPYRSWFLGHDLGRLYREYRDLLALLHWQRPGERWLLKAPAHMWAIDALVESFPDVSLVWSHRDPVAVVSSMCSMTQMVLGMYVYQGDLSGGNPEVLGPRVLEFYAQSLERGLASRLRLDPTRIVDFGHDELVEDPIGIAARVYDHFGIEMTRAVRNALERHVEGNPRGKHGPHEYDLERFGLTRAEVRARFAFYTEDDSWIGSGVGSSRRVERVDRRAGR